MSRKQSLFLAAAVSLLVTGALSPPAARAQIEIHALTEVMEGHEVGGVSVDMVGDIYAADFGDVVWRITPEGERRQFASGFYGASGNAIDRHGDLLQASFYADTLTRIDRNGAATPLVTQGLDRPTGVAVDRRTGDIYVANCRANTVVRVAGNGTVSPFASSPLFNCPYGLTTDREGQVYAVNYQDNRMLRIAADGTVSLFAEVSDQGLGYLCFKGDRFYVTAFRSHEIYEVGLDRSVRRLLGTGERRTIDEPLEEAARLSFPAGIGCHPWAPRVYVNEDLIASGLVLPRRSIVRVIELDD